MSHPVSNMRETAQLLLSRQSDGSSGRCCLKGGWGGCRLRPCHSSPSGLSTLAPTRLLFQTYRKPQRVKGYLLSPQDHCSARLPLTVRLLLHRIIQKVSTKSPMKTMPSVGSIGIERVAARGRGTVNVELRPRASSACLQAAPWKPGLQSHIPALPFPPQTPPFSQQ